MANIAELEHSRRLMKAHAPFRFNSAAQLLRIGGEEANSIAELLQGLRSCPDEAIFQHTMQTLQEHHYIREGFSNDFAHWAFAACNDVALSERLASVDVREFSSLSDVRRRLVEIVETYALSNTRAAERPAADPFRFCATETIVIPTAFEANDLVEFAAALEQVSVYCIHYHFIQARLRLRLNSNDFSVWLTDDMEMPDLAAKVNRIDLYTSTLNDVRRKVIRIVRDAVA